MGSSRCRAPDSRRILIVPYMWIGDFVRCHTVVQAHATAVPTAPSTCWRPRCARRSPITCRACAKGSSADLPRRRLGLIEHLELAARLKAEHYGSALVMSRNWKAALAPFLAGIPERTGFVGEARFVLLNDRAMASVRCRGWSTSAGCSLCRPAPPCPRVASTGACGPARRRSPPGGKARLGRRRCGRSWRWRPARWGRRKRWPAATYAELTRRLLAEGLAVWVVGGPRRKGAGARDYRRHRPPAISPAPTCATAILALAAAAVAVSNDSGLLHVAAALGTPSIGIFGPTSPLALGAAQSARRRHRDEDRARLPALPQAGPAGSAITAACATYRQATSSRRPSARSPRLLPAG